MDWFVCCGAEVSVLYVMSNPGAADFVPVSVGESRI